MVVYNGINYALGEFVYVREDKTTKQIVQIHEIELKSGVPKSFKGCRFYFPHQTFHRASQKFFEKEVIKTYDFSTYSFNQIIEKCCVLFLKDFMRGAPENFDSDHVYVCESRYYEKNRLLSKIKDWDSVFPEGATKEVREVALVLYEQPVIPKRIPSVFAEDSRDHDSDQDKGNASEYADDAESELDKSTADDEQIKEAALKRSKEENDFSDAVQPDFDEDSKQHSKRPSKYRCSWPSCNGLTFNHQTDYNEHMRAHVLHDQEVFRSMGTLAFKDPVITHKAPPSSMATSLSSSASSSLESLNKPRVMSKPMAPINSANSIMAAPFANLPGMATTLKPKNNVVYVGNEQLPYDIVSQYHCSDAGEVVWFPTPPMYVAKEENPISHSNVYMERKEKEKPQKLMGNSIPRKDFNQLLEKMLEYALVNTAEFISQDADNLYHSISQ